MIASLGQMGQWVFDRFVMASGKAHLFIFTLSAASLTNLILDPIFIFGWFGLPRMETAGAALATVIGQFMGCLAGMVINPFTDNLVLKKELVQKLHEADEKLAKAQPKQVKMTPQQFQAFIKNQTEYSIIPKRLYAEKAEFIQKLCDEKEAFVNEIFAAAFKEPKLYPYTEDDYSVMALDIAEDLTLIRVDLPDKGLVPPLCYRIYITYNPQKDEANYYTIEMTKEKDVRLLGGINTEGKHVSYGNAPVEGAELQEIMNLARKPREMTS